MSRPEARRDRGRMPVRGRLRYLVFLIGLILCLSPMQVTASDETKPVTGAEESLAATENPPEKAAPVAAVTVEKPSDEYGNVTEDEVVAGEESHIADPIELWNRAMYHVNDKIYFWMLKPVAGGYRRVVPEGFRGLFTNFYRNVKAPVRIVNNFLQGKPRDAGVELTKFLINSTIGIGGLKDCATECLGMEGREADFGRTLGKYGVGFGFYIVWPLLGPSSPRDTVGWVADRALTPTTYVSSQWISPEIIELYAHETINYTSFHLGDYEALIGAAIDPYVAMRDAYVQYRKKLIER